MTYCAAANCFLLLQIFYSYTQSAARCSAFLSNKFFYYVICSAEVELNFPVGIFCSSALWQSPSQPFFDVTQRSPKKQLRGRLALCLFKGYFASFTCNFRFFLFPSHFGMGIISHEETCCCIGHRNVSLHRETKFTLSVRFELAMASLKTTLDTNSILYF